jgi:hypothetical protein
VGFYQNVNVFADINNLENLDASVDIFSISDSGLILGGAVPITKYFSAGISTRIFQRQAVDMYMSGYDILTLVESTQDDFLAAVFDSVKRSSGLGWGVGLNAGVLLELPLGPKAPRIQLAGTLEDFGQTSFSKFSQNGPILPSSIPETYHGGVSLLTPIGKKWTWTLAVDYRDVLGDELLWEKINFGMEFRNKYVSLRVGLHQGYPSYGLSLEMFPHTRIHFASYSKELGSSLRERAITNYLLQLSIGFNPF